MSEINVLYTFDSNFWRLALVSIYSLMRSKKSDTKITVYCMVAPRTRGFRRIKQIIESQGGKLVWRVVRRRENPYVGYDYSRWSPVIFYRLFAHRIFPELDKLLYLDSDTIIRSDLTKLYNTNISKYVIGGVRDMAPASFPNDKHGKYVIDFIAAYKQTNLYINSGVLLINMPAMRAADADLLAARPKLTYPDQDILNVALDGRIRELPLRYNCVPDMGIDPGFPKHMLHDSADDIVIAHFYAVKPYYYNIVPVTTYSMFTSVVHELGMDPEDFLRADMRRQRKKHRRTVDNKTNIPFVTLDEHGRLRLFGIRIYK